MKVVITNTNNLILNGIAASFTALHQTIIWNTQIKPAYDMMIEMNPDIVICHTSSIDSIVKKALQEYRQQYKLVLCDSCPIPATLIDELNPDLICGLNTEQPIIDSLRKYLTLHNAANSKQYHSGIYDPKLATQLLYVSNIAPNDFILQTLTNIANGTNLQIKIIGPYTIPFVEYLGQTSLEETANFFTSAQITLDFDNNSLYDVAYNNGFAISNRNNGYYPFIGMDALLNDNEAYNKYYKALIDHIRFYLYNNDERQLWTRTANKNIQDNTYCHQVDAILQQLEIS